MAGPKGIVGTPHESFKLQIARVIGPTSSANPHTKAIYMIVDKVEALQKDIEELRRRLPPTDAVARSG